MDETDLSGLGLEGAKEYIFAYAVDAKRLDKAIADSLAELERWKGRVALAEEKQPALAEAARAKAAEEAGKLASLEAERADLRAKIGRMREQLPTIKARERSIDPDRLLAELQLMTGELFGSAEGAGEGPGGPAATEAEFAKLEAGANADSELEALRRRAGGSGAGSAP
jgi:phage shock protein A